MDYITIDIPGAYESSFEGSGVIQHRGDREACGYAGAPGVWAAWTGATIVRRGRGYAIRLAVPVAQARDALECVIELAETCIMADRNAMSGLDSRFVQDRDDRFAYLSEIGACQRLVARCRKALAGLA